jgi:hypothetical protein
VLNLGPTQETVICNRIDVFGSLLVCFVISSHASEFHSVSIDKFPRQEALSNLMKGEFRLVEGESNPSNDSPLAKI